MRTYLKHIAKTQLLGIVDTKIDHLNEKVFLLKRSGDTLFKNFGINKYFISKDLIFPDALQLEDQLAKLEHLKKRISKIDLYKKSNIVEFGSLVITNLAIYFISGGFGLVEINGDKIYAISLASEMGKVLEGKIVGDKIDYKERTIEIIDIF
ncbi:MAG: hypothetical protein MI975_27465 [Cytophagales bacterium]|nr:hypothetical protein [Cytophagales bacterium]